MTDTLRERVARLVCSSWDGGRICSEMCVTCCNTADAAIALVLEEAAKVCEITFDSEMASYGDYFAAAIRALKTPS